jgi:hypothetical protein
MNFREAVPGDIPSIQRVRNSVKENMLSDPGLVTAADCEDSISHRGKGWACEMHEDIVGFAIADLIAATSRGEATTPSTPDASANFTSRVTDSAADSVTPI